MPSDRLPGALEFLREAERLKSTLRSGFTSVGRPESVAEHTWRLCLMALVFADEFGDIDALRLIKLCIVHDLGEALSGDIPAVMQTEDSGKSVRERADLAVLTRSLDPAKRAEILSLWEEYEAAASPEAVLAKGLDKLETILQHNQGKNPADSITRSISAMGRGRPRPIRCSRKSALCSTRRRKRERRHQGPVRAAAPRTPCLRRRRPPLRAGSWRCCGGTPSPSRGASSKRACPSRSSDR